MSEEAPRRVVAPRAMLGGVLMGLANLVPGISGGTMLLASGVYTQFIRAVAEITTFRFSARALRTLLLIAVPAMVAILALAGPVKGLVETRTWIMFALFIGLTLGGVPVVLRMVTRRSTGFYVATVVGIAIMSWLAYERYSSSSASEATAGASNFGLLTLAGIAGASAMILPGISGAFLFIILGVYRTILGAIDALSPGIKALVAGEGFEALSPVMTVVIPVGLGVVIGMVGVSSLIRWALLHHGNTTLGFLFGLLIGSVLSLWPFQRPIAPGSKLFETYGPELVPIFVAVVLVVAGYAITMAIDRYGNRMSASA